MTAGTPGESGLLDPDGAKQWLAAWKGRIDEMAASARAMNARMQELQVSAADPNGMVEVTVNTMGALVGIRFGSRIQRVAPEVVAQAVMDTIAEAKQILADRAQEIIAETMGADSPAGQELAGQLAQQLRGGGDEAGTDAAVPPGWR